MALSTLFWFALKKIVHAALHDWYLRNCREQIDLDVREQRSEKGVTNIFKGLFYIYAASFGYYMLKDSYILPSILGGSGSFREHFRNYPYWDHPPHYTTFYMSCLGFFFYELVAHIVEEDWSKGNFMEMLLHHFVTIYLMLFSFFGNYFIGAPVLLIHNSSDILVCICRALNETKYNKIAGVIFLAAFGTWVYMRCFVYPTLIYQAIFDTDFTGIMPYSLRFLFGLLLSVLQVLHVYWSMLMLNIIISIVFKGHVDDLVNKNKLS